MPTEASAARVRLAHACATFPELAGRRATPALLNRWCTHGARGVVMDSELFGGRRLVSRVDVQEFLAALNAARNRQPQESRKQPQWVSEGLAAARL